MTTITFTVYNENTFNVPEDVLVFLTPAQDQANYVYAAWQNLNPSPSGGSQGFTLNQDISVSATNMDTQSTSNVPAITPGTALSVTRAENGSPYINGSPAPNLKPTPQQCGAENDTATAGSSAMDLQINWLVNSNLVVAQQHINEGSGSLFQLEQTLYFYVGDFIQGPNYSLQEVSAGTPYTIPEGTTDVKVTWTRQGGISGQDQFTFDPPSAVTPPLDKVVHAMRA